MSSKKSKNSKKKQGGGRDRSATTDSTFPFFSKKKNQKSKSKDKSKGKSKGKGKAKDDSQLRVKKQAKTKFKKFEKCPGYDSIDKAQKLEQERKYNSAIKAYAAGIEQLEEYTKHKVDNALEKRSRMQRIEGYRQRMLKLQHQQNMKKSGNASNKPQFVHAHEDNKPNPSDKPQYLPLHKEEGYKLVQAAIQYENDNQLQKAYDVSYFFSVCFRHRKRSNHVQTCKKRISIHEHVQKYEKGLTLLEQNLFSINDDKEKAVRRQKIREWRARQQHCKNELDNKKNNKYTKKTANKSSNSKGVKPLKQEAGFFLCEKAKQYEKDKKYDAAITHYEKGIPLLEDTLKHIDSSSTYRERMQHIESNRHNLQRLKNLKVRRKSVHPSNSRHKRRHTKTLDLTRPDISGGTLYQKVREGLLSKDVVKQCDRMSMYYMLDIVASSCIHLPLPFRSCIGDALLEAMNIKVESSASLQQRLRFFLYSYFSQDSVQTLWGDHPCMPNIIDPDGEGGGGGGGGEADEEGGGEEGATERSQRLKSLFNDEAATKFEDIYMERDAILFFRNLCDSVIEIGEDIDIDYKRQDLEIYDIMGHDVPIHRVRVNKIFKSNAKPLLITAYERKSDRAFKEISKFIIKYGDDLRLDAGAMHMFRFFNSIWSEDGLCYDDRPIQCLLYGVIPMGTDFGAIEFIPKCLALRRVSELFNKFDADNLKNLVASAAGSYIASFVLGVRDRHYDNVLIRSDGTLFHIDFGYVMGSKLFMDTAKIAITGDLQKLFEDHWENFVDTATNAYMTLRLHYQEILDYADLVFDFVDLKCNPSEFLYRMLMMHQSDKKAEETIRNKLSLAPSRWDTKIKNAAHYVATL